jgi:uncharacterized membrane protein YbhN (UPF0104 family)
MRDKAVTLLKVMISAGLLAWTFSRVPLADVSRQLATARPLYLLAGLAVFVLDILADGMKWHVLLRAQGVRVPRTAVLKLQFVGYFFNNFLPAAMLGGDVMRGFGLARLTARPADAAVSVLLDRIVGFLAYVISALVASIIAVNVSGRRDLRHVQALAALAALAIAAALALLLNSRVREAIGPLFGRRPMAALAGPWAHTARALRAYHGRSGALWTAFCYALLGVVCATLVNWLVSRAMGGEMALPLIFLFNPMIALASMLPISIGGLGVTQATYPLFYGAAGVSTEHALAVSVLVQLTQLLASLPGCWFWLRARRAAAAPATSQGTRLVDERKT